MSSACGGWVHSPPLGVTRRRCGLLPITLDTLLHVTASWSGSALNVSSRLDYCNSLLYGVSNELLQKLQVIQNVAARVVTVARKLDDITPVLRELHWLPIRQRIRIKLAMIVYKCLHGLAPPYLADNCVLVSSVSSRRHSRSADTRKLVVRRTRTVIGARDFAVSCAAVWNSLRKDLRVSSLSAATFAWHLKACLFRRPS